MAKQTLVAGVLVGLLLSSGCMSLAGVSEGNGWTLDVSGKTVSTTSGTHLDGEVELGGYYDTVQIRGVVVEFRDEHGATMKTISIGRINSSRLGYDFNVTVAHSPKYLLVFAREIENNDETDYSIFGAVRKSDGKYRPYGDYDPFNRNTTVVEDNGST